MDWSELQEQLFADSWDEELGLHRSSFAFRGRTRADGDLSTSLARLGADPATIERPLLRHFRKYAARDAVPEDSTWNWLSRSTTACRRGCSTGRSRRTSRCTLRRRAAKATPTEPCG